ncbi:ISL3 family transposase [Candidatus Poriferisodalis sp.]|uniref:ISL3 family transposase n=1 Tax=Candidatus Poriferisodalis sp. TaxID=3101277 RepID=UPI003B5CCEFB
MRVDAIRALHVVVGLGAGVTVTGVRDRDGGPLEIGVELAGRPCCVGCGGPVWAHSASTVRLADLPAFGRPVRLGWRKRRWRCPDGSCAVGTFTDQDPAVAPPRARMTSRAARHATRRAGAGRAVSEIAAELGAGWHTVMRAVHRWGSALLDADSARLDGVTALGLDEILMFRRGRYREKHWGTTIVDTRRGRLLDIVAGRSADGATAWIRARSSLWRKQIRWGVMDLSGPYRKTFTDALAHARQVADPFHVIKLANSAIDDVRRRVQNETTGGRGTKHDPLYRIRRLLLKASERVTDRGRAKLRGLLAAGDPRGEVRDAWHAKETLRGVYRIPKRSVAAETLDELARDLQDDTFSAELNKLGRTLATWRTQITNWHRSRVTNGPTEAANNLAKLIKRVSFGITNFDHYRTRVLLYAGKPDWTLLDTLTPR